MLFGSNDGDYLVCYKLRTVQDAKFVCSIRHQHGTPSQKNHESCEVAVMSVARVGGIHTAVWVRKHTPVLAELSR